MRKTLTVCGLAVLAAVSVIAALTPRQDYNSDTTKPPQKRTLTLNQASSQSLYWHFTNGTAALDLTGATACKFYYGPASHAWTVTVTGAVSSATGGVVYVTFTPAQLATNGNFLWQMEVTDSDETLAYAFGEMVLLENITATGSLVLPTNGVVNWAAYSGYQNTSTAGPLRAGDNITISSTNADGSITIATSSGGDITAVSVSGGWLTGGGTSGAVTVTLTTNALGAITNGLAGPSITNGLAGPSITNGLCGPSITNGFVGTWITNGLAGPSITNGLCGPSITNGLAGPSITNGLCGPSITNGFATTTYADTVGQNASNGVLQVVSAAGYLTAIPAKVSAATNADVATYATTANNASNLNGQAAAYYLNQFNLTNAAISSVYSVPFAASNVISLAYDWQDYRPTNTTTIYMPTGLVAYGYTVRLDLIPGTNSVTIATNALSTVALCTNPVVSITTGITNSLLFEKLYGASDWRCFQLPKNP